jgi:mono/diheme cytochrome c family protein
MMKYRGGALIIASGLLLMACGQQESQEFDLELSKQKWNSAFLTWNETDLRLLDKGERLFRKNCSVCHKRDGRGDIQLGASALYNSPIVNGQKPALIQLILKGKKGTSMPPFAATLNDEDIAAIATYIRNAWGNYAADTVAAAEVNAQR